MIAAPYEKAPIAIKIQQQYVFLNNKYWFPEQLNYRLSVKGYIAADGRSYIKDVELEAPLKRNEFAIESVLMDKLATKRDSSFWDAHRVKALTDFENTTYKK